MNPRLRSAPGGALRLRPLPLALGLILSVSAVPVELRPFSTAYAYWGFSPDDILWNLLLYVPLGVALRCNPVKRWVVACALSATVESLQFFYVGRYPALMDIAMNVVGLHLGTLLARRLRVPELLGASRLTGIIALTVAPLLAVAISVGGNGTGFSNWDPELDLTVGDDPAGGNPWNGELRELAIFSSALSRREIGQVTDEGPGTIRDSLDEHRRDALFGLDDPGSLDRLRGVPLLDAANAEEFFASLVQRGSMTVIARLSTAELRQYGPACIVCYSRDQHSRNFVLGQLGRRLVLQVRTPSTGVDAITAPMTDTRSLLRANREVTVAATYDGRISRIYVDGLLSARSNHAAATKLVPFLADSGLPAGTTVVGALVSLGMLALFRPRGSMLLVGIVGGLGGAGLLILAGGADALPGSAAWVGPLGAAGGLTVALSVLPSAAAAPDANNNERSR